MPIALTPELSQADEPAAEIMVARLDAVTRVHTFVEDIELSLDPSPIDVEVMQTDDGYVVKVTARSFAREVTLTAGESTTFRVRTGARELEQALDRQPVLRTANDLHHTQSVVRRG